MFTFAIDSISFSGGATLDLPNAGLLLLVGPNNSGKTSALREIYRQVLTQNPVEPRYVVQDVTTKIAGEADDAVAWLTRTFVRQTDDASDRVVAFRGASLNLRQIPLNWDHNRFRSEAGAFLVNMLDASDRLPLTAPARTIDLYRNAPESYIHLVQLDDDLASAVNRETNDLFGCDLIVNWGGGERVWLHAGTEPERSAQFDRVSARYLRQLDAIPRLENLGDGMRAYIGVFIALMSAAWPVLLIDEPELFLHPPYSRRLARNLARTAATQGRQIIVATHSSDVVQGALDEGVDVSVARVSRDKDSTSVSLLDSGELRALWRHPLLSSASAIDGLFHRGVVVSESDSDSRVYDAGTRQLERRRLLVESPDLYYVQGGGKGELGTLAEAYYKLHVPVAVIADLDLLRESGLVDRVLRALGQDPAHTRGLYGAVAKALADGGGLLTAAEVARQLSETSTRIAQSDRVTTADRGEVEDLVSQALPWARAKCDGIGMLSGDDATKAKELLATWAAVGLHLVPSGELESLWTGRGRRDKRAWSRAALEHLAGDNIIPQLDELLRQVLQHLGIAFGATPEATGPSQDRESN